MPGQFLGHPRAVDLLLGGVVQDVQPHRTPLELPHLNTSGSDETDIGIRSCVDPTFALTRPKHPRQEARPAHSPVAREAMAQLMQADDPDEILWRRINLIMELDGARASRQAPRPEDDHRPVPVPVTDSDPGTEPLLDPAPGLLARLGLRRRVTGRRTVGNGLSAKTVE
ncbi:DUF6397 family protein [Streptomyces sp. NBC_01653]|uniref:DUF6397 family protein n=1 Tax=Streptomyces sp. NBC_01653 TaxID=2975908 RepID=UPI00386822A5